MEYGIRGIIDCSSETSSPIRLIFISIRDLPDNLFFFVLPAGLGNNNKQEKMVSSPPSTPQ